jgi:capsular exopolysaccharide synthesis family protein
MSKKNREKDITSAVSLTTLLDKSSPISEQYRTIRTNIQFSATVGNEIKTLVVTSSGPGEGKTTTAANLAVVFANSGQKVLLVDADLRKPTIHKTFNVSNNAGLSTVLSTNPDVNLAIQPTATSNLFVMTSGPKPPNPSELLGSVATNSIIETLRKQFDIVIFDMPPVVAVTDAQIMSAKVDGTLLVVREGVSRKEALLKAKQLLIMSKANVLGAIYKGSKNATDEGYYYYGA